ncbi:TlpA disulfide reductase family protein [Sphingomonadaceae bacterium jetA1]|jgi:thiol-disulfide isomerase/thioredoxin|uniref:redoxin domain-containing protein n=1 Tax=Facivitalis istanbulensis TaxID=3075838 RepID=UPI003482B0F5
MGGAAAIGPILIATDRGIAILCILLFFGLAALAARWGATRFAGVATSIVLAGIVTARIGYVARHATIYADAPWSMLALWQGGFSPLAGVAGAASMLLIRLGRGRDALFGLGALAIPTMLWFGVQTILPTADHGRFPDHVTLADAAGKPMALDRFRGRPFVVNLWATWCGPCRRELPMLDAVAGTSDVPIILADQGEAPGTVAAFLRAEGIAPQHVALDIDRQLSGAFTVGGYPATIFIAADGTIVQTRIGEMSRAALADGIDMARKHR